MIDDHCQPSVVTYTILIQASIKRGGIEEALKVLSEMSSKGLQPDNYTWNAVIKGLCKQGLVDSAYDLVSKLWPCDHNYNTVSHDQYQQQVPDVVSYNILLRAFLDERRWKDAERLMNEMMMVRGRQPNTVTYSVLINALCQVFYNMFGLYLT